MLKILTGIILFFSLVANSYSQQGWQQMSIGDGNIISINFVDQNTGFAFRNNGWLMKTTNGGSNWEGLFLNFVVGSILSGSFSSNNLGGLYNSSKTYITTNGGMSWNQSSPPKTGTLIIRKIIMMDDNTGFACGVDYDLLDNADVNGVILKTTNAGLNWVATYPGGFDYYDIKFKNSSTGYSCKGELMRTTNGGSNWALYSHAGIRQMYAISQFFNDTFYVASNGGYILKTINGGLNWTQQQTIDNVIFNDIFFISNNYGYVSGDSGIIYKTTNGGVNWQKQISNTIQRLNEINFLNKDTGFIVGDSGTFLVTYNGGVASLSQNNQSIPEKFNLYQNFPNPFNPSTIIQFDIIKNSKVRLSIYDISGKLIEVLVDQELTAGSFEYSYNPKSLPSGIYFYRLETEKFTETKRMVLIK